MLNDVTVDHIEDAMRYASQADTEKMAATAANLATSSSMYNHCVDARLNAAWISFIIAGDKVYNFDDRISRFPISKP